MGWLRIEHGDGTIVEMEYPPKSNEPEPVVELPPVKEVVPLNENESKIPQKQGIRQNRKKYKTK